MDPLRAGRISFTDFCRAARFFGGIYDIPAFWKSLDTNEDGFVTLAELDRSLSHLLNGFGAALSRACGTAAKAWEKHFGGCDYGRCPKSTFEMAARKLGYFGNAGAVFDALDVNKCGVSFKEFVLLDRWFQVHPLSPRSAWPHNALRPALKTSRSAPSLCFPAQ